MDEVRSGEIKSEVQKGRSEGDDSGKIDTYSRAMRNVFVRTVLISLDCEIGAIITR
jgi:hypothetical protein